MNGLIRDKKTLSDSGEWVTTPEYLLDGQVVSKETFDAAFPDREMDAGFGVGSLHSGWPIKSDAMGVHPKQIKEAAEHARKRGVPTDFDKSGRPLFRDRSHQRAYLKTQRCHNNDEN